MPDLWERQAGETAKAFAAFELYRGMPATERSGAKVAQQLGRAKQLIDRWSSANSWVVRVRAWDDHLAAAAREEAVVELERMVKRHANLAVGFLGKVTRRLQSMQPDDLQPRDLVQWTKVATDLERMSRGQLVGDQDTQGQAAGAFSTEEQWRRTYVCPEGAFIPHRLQRDAINSDARFLALVAGVQSGKTAGSAIAFWRRILSDRRRLAEAGDLGFYWMVAPNSIVGEVMVEAFEEFAPPGEILRTRGQRSGRTWELRDGTRVQFRSAEKADRLVARRCHGAWLDEFTLLSKDVWVTSVRQRLATTGGWAIFSGTPRGRNWAWEEVWRRALPDDDKHDQDYEGFTWPSSENPAVSREEVEAARRQLPAAYFRREWEASWEAFHGQIYEAWSKVLMQVDLLGGVTAELMPPARTVMGVDWGFANPGALVVARQLVDGRWEVVEEVQESGKLPGWWQTKITDLWRKWKVETIWCDPEDAGRIAALVADGLPARKANNDVHAGIRHLAALMAQQRLRVDRTCTKLADQVEAYHWKEDRSGRRSEQPVKENDHLCDALRYSIFSTYRDLQREPGRRYTYGGRPK